MHDAAVSLAAAAADDLAEDLRTLGQLESGCVSCHTNFRKRLTN